MRLAPEEFAKLKGIGIATVYRKLNLGEYTTEKEGRKTFIVIDDNITGDIIKENKGIENKNDNIKILSSENEALKSKIEELEVELRKKERVSIDIKHTEELLKKEKEDKERHKEELARAESDKKELYKQLDIAAAEKKELLERNREQNHIIMQTQKNYETLQLEYTNEKSKTWIQKLFKK